MKSMWGKSGEDGCGGEEKERTTEVEVDGQCKWDFREKGLSHDRADAIPGCVKVGYIDHT